MDSVSEEPAAAAAAAAALCLLPVNLCVHYLLNRSFKKKKRQLCTDHIVDVLPSTGSYFFFIKVWI